MEKNEKERGKSVAPQSSLPRQGRHLHVGVAPHWTVGVGCVRYIARALVKLDLLMASHLLVVTRIGHRSPHRPTPIDKQQIRKGGQIYIEVF